MKLLTGCLAVGLIGLSLGLPPALAAQLPVIDVHLHALAASDQGPPPLALCAPIAMPTWDSAKPPLANFVQLFKGPQPCPDPIVSPTKDEDVLKRTVAQMEQHNVYGVLAGPSKRVALWMKAAPGRFLPSLEPTLPLPSLAVLSADLKSRKAKGEVAVLGEIGVQYDGMAVTDAQLAPLWAAAEQQDLPVAVHFGPGPPGVAYMPGSGYRAKLSSPLLMEDILVKHPQLRVNIMHAGYPMLDATLALLYAHPQVYVDTGVIVWTQPRAEFYRYLQALVTAGFGKRVMFGSDQMVWPESIGIAIRVIEEAPFLSSEQKRDILYDNAARFLRLDAGTIARHHGR